MNTDHATRTNAAATADTDLHDTALQYARIRQILRECRIVHLNDDELSRIRLFYTGAGIHPKAHVPFLKMPVPCDPNHGAIPLRIAA